jgi:large subunit ribosomal protein L21
MTYAVIRLAGKQYRVQEGDTILVDRLGEAEGKAFHPDVLLFADDGKTELAPKGVQVTAKVVGHVLGDKIRIGKYKAKSGYKRHAGHRSRLSEVAIEKVAKKAPARKPAAEKAVPEAPAAEKPKPAAAKKPAPARETKPAAKKTTAARKPAAKKETT